MKPFLTCCRARWNEIIHLERLPRKIRRKLVMVHMAASAASRSIPRDRGKALQVPQGPSRSIPKPLRSPEEEVLLRNGLYRRAQLHQLPGHNGSLAEELQQFLDTLPSPAPDLDLATIIEIVDEFGVGGIGIAGSGRETVVLAELEVHAPGVLAGVEQTSPSKVHHRRLSPGAVAEAARIEAIAVLVRLLRSFADGDEMLDSREPRSLDPMGGQVCLMQEAKSASESELPADA